MHLRNYAVVTGGYWAFTVTDGALRMLVLLQFHKLGYSPLAIAMLFVLYELMGVTTNLFGGWAGSRVGLNRTLAVGLALQTSALLALSLHQESWSEWASVGFVMSIQAIAGVAKDLTKMSSKSAVKLVANQHNSGSLDKQSQLFRWVALLTGSKNALKGVGFFVGAALLSWLGFAWALVALSTLVGSALLVTLTLLDEDIGRSSAKAPIRSLLAKSPAINRLSASRFFLFGARDLWFVVALPIFLSDELGWTFEGVGAFLAAWVIGYGIIQSAAPQVLRGYSSSSAPTDLSTSNISTSDMAQTGYLRATHSVGLILTLVTSVMAALVSFDVGRSVSVIGGLLVFGAVFALNSSVHSFLILAYSDTEDVAMDVGFYYSANAAGRLAGTIGSGVLYLAGGLPAALWGSATCLLVAWLLSLRLPAIQGEGGAEAAPLSAK